MPFPVYSTTFVQKQGLDGELRIIGQPGFVIVLAELDAYTGAELAPTVLYLHGKDGQAVWFAVSDPTAGPGYFSWRGRLVIQEGEAASVFPASGTWDVTVSGYRLIAA